MKFTEERRLQLWRRTITQRNWEDNLWLETQNREVNKWLIDDKDKWVIKSKMNVKGLATTFENTRKNKWNDVIMKYRTLRMNKTTYWEATKNTKDIRKRSNANYLRWITSWKRTEEKRNTDEEQQWKFKERKEELDDWKWNKKDPKENENEEIRERTWEWWKRDSKRMKEGNRNKVREWERIETKKGPKQKPENNVAYKEH